MDKILCVPQRGIGDLVHTLPLIHSLRNAFVDCKIIIPVVDSRQKEDRHSLAELCEGVLTFSYRPIKDSFESRRLELSRNKDSHMKYRLEAKKRMQLEKEMYKHYLRGKKYDLSIVLGAFNIENLDCPRHLNLGDIFKKKGEHVVDRNLRFTEILNIPKIYDFSLNLNHNNSPKNCLGEDIVLPSKYVIFFLGAGRPSKKWTSEGNKIAARFCISKGYAPVLMGSKEDYEIFKEIDEFLEEKFKRLT